MPKLTGLFDYFPKLSDVKAEGVAVWLGSKVDAKLLENRLGNRILYSSTIPYSADDIIFDLAILREAIKACPQDFFNRNLRQIYIPEEFLQHFPDLRALVIALIDALRPRGITSVMLKSKTLGLKSLGSVIVPEISSPTGIITIQTGGQRQEVKVGSLVVIAAEGSKVDISLQSRAAKLFGKDDITLEVAGGALGLLVDARK